jgi:hypothetical protein
LENSSAFFTYKGYRGHKKSKGGLPSPFKQRMGRDPFSKHFLKPAVNCIKNYLKLYLCIFLPTDQISFSFFVVLKQRNPKNA